MFQENKNEGQNFSGGENPDIRPQIKIDNEKNNSNYKNTPVFTMKKDMENANEFNGNSGDINKKLNLAENNFSKSFNRENPSPFLSQENWRKDEKEAKEINQQLEMEPKKRGLGKAIMAALIVFIVLTAAGGGYYFWLMRSNESAEEATVSLPEPEIVPEKLPVFSTENPNYLSVDLEGDIEVTLNEYADKITQAEIVQPVEFIITDASNSPVTFQIFAEKTGMIFSENIMQDIGSDFSLYFYNDSGKMRLGFSVASLNDTALSSALTQEELKLQEDISPLYLETYIPSNSTFSESEYQGIVIRYANIDLSGNLSIDYAIYKNQLLVGTSKMTLRSIIDYMGTAESKPILNIPDINE